MKVKKMLAVFMSVLSLAACILPFSGCGKTVGKVHNKGVKSGAVRDLTEGISKNESASKAPDDEFKAAASSFAAELFKDNYSKGKTTLVSPLSRLLLQIGRSSLSFELPLSFEQAAAYRKANGQYVRKNQWRDTTVRVFIDLD